MLTEKMSIKQGLNPIYISGDLPTKQLMAFANELALTFEANDHEVVHVKNIWSEQPTELNRLLGNVSIIKGLYISFGVARYLTLFDASRIALNETALTESTRFSFIVNRSTDSFAKWVAEACYADIIHAFLKASDEKVRSETVWSFASPKRILDTVCAVFTRTPVLITGTTDGSGRAVYQLKTLQHDKLPAAQEFELMSTMLGSERELMLFIQGIFDCLYHDTPWNENYLSERAGKRHQIQDIIDHTPVETGKRISVS